MTPAERRLRYERLKRMIPLIVKRTIDQKETIQGERSVEAQVPDKYRRETRDYDVYSNSPEQSANETEKELDWEFGGDYFRVQKGVHKGTYKVVSNVDEDGWVDYTKPTERIKKTKIGETNYTTLKFELEKAIRTLRQKKYAYRHEKEKNKIKRITKALALKESMNRSIAKTKLKGKKQKWL